MDIRVERIKNKLVSNGGVVEIPLLKGNKTFTVVLKNDGVEVSNLANQPFLPWEVFYRAIEILELNNGVVEKGAALSGKLGEPKI